MAHYRPHPDRAGLEWPGSDKSARELKGHPSTVQTCDLKGPSLLVGPDSDDRPTSSQPPVISSSSESSTRSNLKPYEGQTVINCTLSAKAAKARRSCSAPLRLPDAPARPRVLVTPLAVAAPPSATEQDAGALFAKLAQVYPIKMPLCLGTTDIGRGPEQQSTKSGTKSATKSAAQSYK